MKTVLLVFGALALAVGLVIEQALRIEDDYILQAQIDELRKRMEELESETNRQ